MVRQLSNAVKMEFRIDILFSTVNRSCRLDKWPSSKNDSKDFCTLALTSTTVSMGTTHPLEVYSFALYPRVDTPTDLIYALGSPVSKVCSAPASKASPYLRAVLKLRRRNSLRTFADNGNRRLDIDINFHAPGPLANTHFNSATTIPNPAHQWRSSCEIVVLASEIQSTTHREAIHVKIADNVIKSN